MAVSTMLFNKYSDIARSHAPHFSSKLLHYFTLRVFRQLHELSQHFQLCIMPFLQ
jgi:hypothetical protein